MCFHWCGYSRGYFIYNRIEAWGFTWALTNTPVMTELKKCLDSLFGDDIQLTSLNFGLHHETSVIHLFSIVCYLHSIQTALYSTAKRTWVNTANSQYHYQLTNFWGKDSLLRYRMYANDFSRLKLVWGRSRWKFEPLTTDLVLDLILLD